MASTDKDLYEALMGVTRELSRVATLLETQVRINADQESRLRKVEKWVTRLPATLFTAVASALVSAYMLFTRLTGKG